MASLHPNFHCSIVGKHATSNQLEALRTYHKTQTLANHFIDELKEYTWIERLTELKQQRHIELK